MTKEERERERKFHRIVTPVLAAIVVLGLGLGLWADYTLELWSWPFATIILLIAAVVGVKKSMEDLDKRHAEMEEAEKKMQEEWE